MLFQINKNASIHIGCKFSTAKHFSLGENSTINQNCHLDNRGGLFIGNNVSISHRTAFITADHLINDSKFQGRNRPIYIGDLVFIGFGVVILGGIKIEKGAVIGAYSLITKNVEAFDICMGNPAKKVKSRNKDLNYTTNYRRLFH